MPALLFTPLVTLDTLPAGAVWDPFVVVEEKIGGGKPVLPKSVVEIEVEGYGGTEREFTSSVSTGLPWRFVASDQWVDPWMVAVVQDSLEGAVRTVMIRTPGAPIKRLRVWIRKVQTLQGR